MSPSMISHFERRQGFTLVELVIVIVVLGILATVALPKFHDFSGDARTAADEAAIGGISEALNIAFLRDQLDGAPAAQWIDEVDDIAGVMSTGELPDGITINGAELEDQRGNTYTLTAQTADSPARLTMDYGGGGGGS